MTKFLKCDLLKHPNEIFSNEDTANTTPTIHQKPKGDDFSGLDPESDEEDEFLGKDRSESGLLGNKLTSESTNKKDRNLLLNIDSHDGESKESLSDKSLKYFNMGNEQQDELPCHHSCGIKHSSDQDFHEEFNFFKQEEISKRKDRIVAELRMLKKLEEIQKEEIQLGLNIQSSQENFHLKNYFTEDSNPKQKLKINTEECSNFHELSSIYENTEEELCTPDRETIGCSIFNPIKSRSKRDRENFKSVAITLKPDFYDRMESDIKERNLRDYSIKHFANKPHNYSSKRRLSRKKADTISKRLHSGSRPSLDRQLKNSKSLRTLNLSENSRGSSEHSAASRSRKRIFSKHRNSVVVKNQVTKRLKVQINQARTRKSSPKNPKSIKEKRKILSKLLPSKNKKIASKK